jgi:hypothetical protein
MNTRRLVAGFTVAMLGGLAADAPAHHSLTVEFDISKTVTLTGVITEMRWTNPHAWLYVDVTDEQGKVRNVAVEFGSPNSLYRRGWRRDDLPPSNMVTVTGYPSLDESPRISATDVTLPDGRRLFAGAAPSGAQ